MKQEDIKIVEERIKTFEAQTGCELLLVVAKESDPYPAASWRFGFVSSFIISLTFSYYFEFHHFWMPSLFFFTLVLILSWVGHFPWAKKLALSDWETQRECQEKAIELFHSLGTQNVSHKVTAMIMVSELERRIEVLVDETLREKVSGQDLNEMIEIMTHNFRSGDKYQGFIKSIDLLENKILSQFDKKLTQISPQELSDKIHFIGFQ